MNKYDFEKDVQNALKVLKEGGIILYPTDTVWGLGCDATNPEAVRRLQKIKGDNKKNGIIILLENDNFISFYVKEVPEIAYELSELSEKPITIIYPQAKGLPENVIANDNSIAIRIVRDDFCKRLIRLFRRPIISTSANFSGEKTPVNFDDINPKIKEKMDYVVQHGQANTKTTQSSSIIKIDEKGRIEIIRE